MPPKKIGKPSKKETKTSKKEGETSKKEGEMLSGEKIEGAELRAKIKDMHTVIRKLYKDIPPIQKYTSGNIETLKTNLKRLEDMKDSKESETLKNRIRIMYNRFLKNGKPLPESLEFYIENKSLHELCQIESKLEIDLADTDIDRGHQKLVKEIGSVISALEKFGDKEPYDNYNKYIGTADNELPNEILRSNLKTLKLRLKDLHDKQAQPGPSTDTEAKKAQPSPKPEAKKAQPSPKPEAKKAQPSPKPEAKKSKGKEKAKDEDEDDTLILNSLTKMSDSELEKYNNNEELKKQFIISLFGHDIVPTDMAILVGKLNNEIRELKYKKRLGAPIRSDMQPIIISKQKEFDNGIKMIDDLVSNNNIEEASELATKMYDVVTTAFLKGDMTEKEYGEKKAKLISLIKKDKNLKARKVGKYFHHDFLNKNIKKVSIL